jgi:hypothetical protein
MSQSEILELAKNGDPQAISVVINKSLAPKGISAKTSLSGGCLTIVLESEKAVSEAPIVEFIKSGISRLAPENITRIIIRSRMVGKSTDSWRNAFTLDLKQVSSQPPQAVSKVADTGKVMSHPAIKGFSVAKIHESLPDFVKSRQGERLAIVGATFLLTSGLWFTASVVGGGKAQSNSKQVQGIAALPFVPKPEVYAIKGKMTLVDSDLDGSDENCYGTGGYSDIKAGMPVTIKDGSGAIIATGDTGSGSKPTGSEHSSVQCTFSFSVGNIPKADFYQVQVGRRGGLNFSFAEIQEKNWEIALSLTN